MNEEIEAGAAPAPEVAEAAPAEAAPSAEAAPASEEAPVAEESSLPEASESGEGAPASFPSADDFGWDTWDGSHEAFHEQVQPWAQRVNDYHTSRFEKTTRKHNQQIDRLENLYKSLLGGQEDPRIEEYETKLSDWEGKYSTLQTEYDDYQNSIKQSIQQESEAYAEWFKTENEDLFTNETTAEAFVQLLETGWDLEPAAEAARLPQEAREIAMRAKADGVPDSYALKLASGAKKAAPAPRPGAKITAGATTPARSAEQKVAELDTNAMSFKDHRSFVARKALKRHRS